MKKPLRLMLLIVAMMLLGFSARAGSITEEQAKAKAQSFLQARYSQSSGKRLAPARVSRQLQSATTGEKTLYVFNIGSQDGFVIVSGDDRTRSILGYADSGTFDANHVPAALNEMLAIYARQIEMLGQTRAKSDSVSRPVRASRRTSGVMSDVTPLLTTTWDQGSPYNNYCPTLNDQTALTGCVATAMAQIAYYHKFPTSQVPNLAAYTSATNKINVSAWGATTFDWDNMLNSYSGSETNTQKAAVATLMRYCGQAAQMDYGFTSGAYNGDALYAFKEKLGYNMNADFKSAASYSANGWEDLIYKEVSGGRPVYYSALNGDDGGPQCGGHAFVIDGYKADGNYFHVNWGWGGACNGYFNLFALDSSAPESAPTATGWHYQMLAIIGLSPEAVNTAKLMKDASGSWLITSADDWNELSANLEAYNGGSFKLTQDISVTTMIGTDWQNFSGTFDGQGHTLTVNIESDGWGVAPFNYVNSGTTIKNLKTQGTVTSNEFHASGLVGGTTNYGNFTLTITNCEVAVQVNGTDHAGGFIGHAINMQPVFTDCIFSGSINGCHDHGCFVGWKEWESCPVYINCLSIPTSFSEGYSCDFSHPGNGGSADQATLTNCYSSYTGGFGLAQGISLSSVQMAEGLATHGLQAGSRDWTTTQVWGQQLGTDLVPIKTNDASKAVHKVSFELNGQVIKTVFTNSTIGNKMPAGEDFGLANATFTCNGSAFTSTTPITSDITVTMTGTSAFTLTLGTPANGSISINNATCMPGTVKKITATPANGYVVSAITVTDANGKALPVTPVSNNANEFVFVFPKSSVTVNAEFTAGEEESVRFINGGMTLPCWWNGQTWTADTWTIWSYDYQPTIGTPPVDAFGHQWYEEGYVLTNSDENVQPNGNKIIWGNHTSPFGEWRNYDYARACGAGDDTPNNFYMRRFFTFDTETVPTKLYLSSYFDDAPIEVYINGTLIYGHSSNDIGEYKGELTPEQIALIHTDGTPNVLAARVSQGGGDYFLDCGLYDPTALSYEVTSENTVRVLRNEFLTGDVVIPETVTYNGVTYSVTELANDVFNEIHYGMTSVSLPPTLTNVGNNTFWGGCTDNKYIKSYVPIYQPQSMRLLAAPADATEFELPIGYTGIWDYAFGFTENLKTLTLPRSLTEICENVFVGCTSLTDIYSYARPVPQTAGNAFEGLDKSKITVHAYASALNSYKESWGEDFNYVTMTDPQPITLTINVTDRGTLHTLIEAAVAEKSSTIFDVTGVTVTGNINQDDLWTLSQMCTGANSLATIDLSGANIEGNYIGDNMFRDREKLTLIILPETLEYINEASFHNCDGLTSIDIPASVKRLWHNAFSYCDNLATVTGLEGLTESNCWEAWDVFLNTAITHPVYGGSVFLYMPPSMTGEYEVPAGVKMTTADAMRGSQLSSVILPASLTDLGDDTFRDCPNLVDIYCYATTPPSCHSGVWEFGFDQGACTVHVPASAVEDYQNADEWRDMGRIVGIATGELVDMTLQVATAGTLNDALFNATVAEAQISDKTLIRNLTVTGNLDADDIAYLNTLPNTLYNMVMLDLSGATLAGNAVTERMFYATLYKAIKLPATVTSIANEAFCDSRRLREIMLPETLESIGYRAFAGTGLTSITIPDAVTEMGEEGVLSCSALTSITLGNGLTSIPNCWAEYCDNIEELTIGKSMTSIGQRAFRSPNIKHVYSYAKMPPSWFELFYNGIPNDAVLHVYTNSVKRYQNADGWKDFPTIVGDLGTYTTYDITVDVATMGTFNKALAAAMTDAGCEDMLDISKLTVTGNLNTDDLYYLRDNVGAVLDKLDLGAVKLENNTMGWGNGILAGCSFEELVLPTTLEYLDGWEILGYNGNLKTINLPASLKIIRPCFLYGCTSLESVTGGEGVIEMEDDNGQYFDNCPSLKAPVILNHFIFRMNRSFSGAYEMPDHVTAIARDAMSGVVGMTALTLPESLSKINGYVFFGDENLKDIYFYAIELPNTDWEAFEGFDRSSCTLHVYEEMTELFQNNELWGEFNIVGDLGPMPNLTPINEADYADLCAIYNTFGGDSWRTKWMINKNIQTASRWRGITFDNEGYVTAIDLNDNRLSGDVSSLTFSGFTKLTSLKMSGNALTGDIQPLAASLPVKCKLNVEHQDLGYMGEHTLYEICRLSEGLPTIAFYNSESGTLASTLIGVGGYCQFYHGGTNGGEYWDSYIHADGGTQGYNKFYWSSPATIECVYPHHFTFTYKYEMGDANMDDALNVLDLQATLNASNGQEWGLFNFYAADTYGPDNDINVQDIVSTVNILLAQESQEGNAPAGTFRAASLNDGEACVSVENGQIILYTTKPVAAIELRLAGIEPEYLKWNIEDMGFATATSAQANGTHAIIYSMQLRQMEEGRTVLATFDASIRPHLMSAVLSDNKARSINVGHTVPTGISRMSGDVANQWSLTDLSGLRLATGSHATEADIVKLAKSRKLQGVFILNIDDVKRKIVIK